VRAVPERRSGDRLFAIVDEQCKSNEQSAIALKSLSSLLKVDVRDDGEVIRRHTPVGTEIDADRVLNNIDGGYDEDVIDPTTGLRVLESGERVLRPVMVVAGALFGIPQVDAIGTDKPLVGTSVRLAVEITSKHQRLTL